MLSLRKPTINFMVYYLKSVYAPKDILSYLKYRLNFISWPYRSRNSLLNDYLLQKYKINLNTVLGAVISNLKVNQIGSNQYQCYLDSNATLNGYRVIDLAQLVEYGNLEIKPNKLISKIITAGLR